MARCSTFAVTALGAACCLILTLWLVGLARQMIAPPPVRLTSLTEVSRVAPLTFPKDAVLMDAASWALAVNGYMAARIRMPRSELHQFLAQPPFAGRVSSAGRDLLDSSVVDRRAIAYLRRERGWHPETARHFLSSSGSFPIGSFNHLCALIDLDSPTGATLYLYYQE